MLSLPGGIFLEGELRRDYRFLPITGALELALGESARFVDTHAAQITTVLSQTLDSIGGTPVSEELVRNLSVGDRQFLMVRLAAHIDDQPVWLTAPCSTCGERFDVSYRYLELPVKRAGDEYPCAMVSTTSGDLLVRVPTGADQELIASAAEEEEGMRILLRCIVSSSKKDAEFAPAKLDTAAIHVIEQRVEAMAPEIATELLSQCPHCDADNTIALNPYACLAHPVEGIFDEVHTIASHYHWSEQAILEMPRDRRQTYLRLIDSGRGMHGSADSSI